MGWFSYDERDLNKDLNDIDNAFNKAKKEMREIDQSIKGAKLNSSSSKKAWSYNVDDLARAFKDVVDEAERIQSKMDKSGKSDLADKASQLATVAKSAQDYAKQVSELEPRLIRHWTLLLGAVSGASNSVAVGLQVGQVVAALGASAAGALAIGTGAMIAAAPVAIGLSMVGGRFWDWVKNTVTKEFKDPLKALDPLEQSKTREAEKKLSEAEKEAKELDRVVEDLGKKKKLLDAAFTRMESLHSALVSQAKKANWDE